MNISLSNEKKLELEKLHGSTRDGRVRDRIKAVLLASEGWTALMISQALRIHEMTVHQHIHDYLQSEKLKPENGGSKGKLSVEQTDQLIEHLTEQTYFHNYEIVAYVKAKWGIQFTVSGMHKWLHQHGFSYKKPKGVPHKFDEQKQQQFIEDYKELKASSNSEEPVIFIDAVHPTQATKVSQGWIRKGKDKSVKTTGSRTRLNLIGALNLNDIAHTVVRKYERINSETICEFFDTLRQTYPIEKKLRIILDGAGYHRSQVVKDKASELNIELHYLPPYSPNLNPIERLWKVMNEHARNNKYFASAKEFREKIMEFFDVTLPDIADSLVSRLNDNFQILKPAS